MLITQLFENVPRKSFFSDILLLKSFVLTHQQLLPTNLAETLSRANIDRHIYKRDHEVQTAHCSGYWVLSHVWNQGLAARKWLTRDSWAVSTTSRKCKGHSAIKAKSLLSITSLYHLSFAQKYLMVLVLHQRIIHLSSLCTGIQRWEHCCAFNYIWHANMLSDFVFHSNFSVILSEKTSLVYSFIQYHCF